MEQKSAAAATSENQIRRRRDELVVDTSNCLDSKFFYQKYHIKYLDTWSIKYGQNKKPIAQFAGKLRDKSFEPNYAMIWQYDATVNIC